MGGDHPFATTDLRAWGLGAATHGAPAASSFQGGLEEQVDGHCKLLLNFSKPQLFLHELGIISVFTSCYISLNLSFLISEMELIMLSLQGGDVVACKELALGGPLISQVHDSQADVKAGKGKGGVQKESPRAAAPRLRLHHGKAGDP